MQPRFTLVVLGTLGLLCTRAQPSPDELAPLYAGFAEGPSEDPSLSRRVPLSTNDSTKSPLIDLQVFAPPVVPSGPSCSAVLLEYSFGQGSYDTPAVVPYKPPTALACGKIGEWAAISLNLSVYS
jgi:hypothetical protein